MPPTESAVLARQLDQAGTVTILNCFNAIADATSPKIYSALVLSRYTKCELTGCKCQLDRRCLQDWFNARELGVF